MPQWRPWRAWDARELPLREVILNVLFGAVLVGLILGLCERYIFKDGNAGWHGLLFGAVMGIVYLVEALRERRRST